MKRWAAAALALTMLFVSAAGVSARSHGGGQGERHRRHHDATFSARAGQAEPGQRMALRVRVKHGQWGVPLTADATVHFASGDVTVQLVQRWAWSNVARGWVGVPDGEEPGQVLVEFSVAYGDTTQSLQAWGTVLDPDEDEDGHDGDDGGSGGGDPPNDPPADPTPAPTPSPEPTDQPQN